MFQLFDSVQTDRRRLISPRLAKFAVFVVGNLFAQNVFVANATAESDSRPNIVLILADDMGYEALSANGSDSCESPHLDRLAAEGIRFTNCFANPLCTPSRVKLMTGQYNVRNYVKFGVLDRGQRTFAHQLQTAGYTTCIAGKWQLGREVDAPAHFGFSQSCLWQHTRSGRTKQKGTTYDRRYVNPLLEYDGRKKDYVDGEYGPDLCTDFICDFIEGCAEGETPFLAYYPMILTHCPFDPTPDSRDWDPKRLGSSTYKGDLNDPQRHFREMVSYADQLVGRIISQLEESKVRDNTLVLFTGDNGTDEPIRTLWNGRTVVGGKGTMTDEGTRVPMIASWPNGIRQPGRTSDTLVEFSDVMPTLCELAQVDLPPQYPGDGSSLVPVLRNETGLRKKDWIYIWYGGKVIVRDEEYSLVAKADGTTAKLTRYNGPFDGITLKGKEMSKSEKAIKAKFLSKLREMKKQRLSGVDEAGRDAAESHK